ncbi:MAG: ATP-binding cassette domain-containing protein, partial [Candidatus Heimdallarchaeota archaeon]|nr:ATP-binding cassette domain-containing protein [Candidatus Heimdallarchaeota archaeon]
MYSTKYSFQCNYCSLLGEGVRIKEEVIRLLKKENKNCVVEISLSLEKNEPIIEFLNVSKNYKDVQALREASFSIKQGDIFGYIGPNGAGKTTTLKILVGLISDYSGEVKINNEFIKNQSNFNQQIGYLPQDVGFQEWRSVDHALVTF